MKTRMFLVAAAMLVFACAGFGQGFSAFIYNDLVPLHESNPESCDGGPFLAEGTPIGIYWDNDSNGPDADDPLAPLCNNPPDCADGPVGTVNFNTFVINGVALGLGEGLFATESNFTSVADLVQPPRFFLRILCPDGSLHYNTPVHTFISGPQEWAVYEWVCTPCVTVPPCTPTPFVGFVSNVVPAYVCADLCIESTTVIHVCPEAGGVLDPTKTPIVSVVPGCSPTSSGCDVDCPPAQFIYNPAGWVFDPVAGCFSNVIIGVSEGCVCVALEGFLAASIQSFDALPGDNKVTVNWVTSSEVGVSSYAVVRDGEIVGTVASENSPSSHTYSFTDESAVNGTTYSYGLRVNNTDGSVTTTTFEVTATPSFNNAVVTEYALHQNFPNPFNPSTSITFDVVDKNFVSLKVFNAAGQEVATVANGEFDAGRHVVSFDAGNMPSGLYFYTVKIGNEFSATKKMLLVK